MVALERRELEATMLSEAAGDLVGVRLDEKVAALVELGRLEGERDAEGVRVKEPR